jgi:hypothetical protein
MLLWEDISLSTVCPLCFSTFFCLTEMALPRTPEIVAHSDVSCRLLASLLASRPKQLQNCTHHSSHNDVLINQKDINVSLQLHGLSTMDSLGRRNYLWHIPQEQHNHMCPLNEFQPVNHQLKGPTPPSQSLISLHYRTEETQSIEGLWIFIL